jgi:hypothetical protein
MRSPKRSHEAGRIWPAGEVTIMMMEPPRPIIALFDQAPHHVLVALQRATMVSFEPIRTVSSRPDGTVIQSPVPLAHI